MMIYYTRAKLIPGWVGQTLLSGQPDRSVWPTQKSQFGPRAASQAGVSGLPKSLSTWAQNISCGTAGDWVAALRASFVSSGQVMTSPPGLVGRQTWLTIYRESLSPRASSLANPVFTFALVHRHLSLMAEGEKRLEKAEKWIAEKERIQQGWRESLPPFMSDEQQDKEQPQPEAGARAQYSR